MTLPGSKSAYDCSESSPVNRTEAVTQRAPRATVLDHQGGASDA